MGCGISWHAYVRPNETFLCVFGANDHAIAPYHDCDGVWCTCRIVNAHDVSCAFTSLTGHVQVATGATGGSFSFYKFKHTTLAFILYSGNLFFF